MTLHREQAWLLLVAFAHTWPALWLGATDGDVSLLWVALPFVVLTLVAAAVVRRWPGVSLTLCVIAATLSVMSVGLYLLGLLHLLQCAVALVVCVRAASRPRVRAQTSH